MRLTGGMGKGRRLVAPPSRVRPTSARVREILFQRLSDRIPHANVLDLYAGSGVLGLETLARGASRAVFVEIDRSVVRIVRKNIELCGFQEESTVVPQDVMRFLARAAERFSTRFDLVFADPPYESVALGTLCDATARSRILKPDGVLVFEESSRTAVTVPEEWGVVYDRVIGDTRLLVLQRHVG